MLENFFLAVRMGTVGSNSTPEFAKSTLRRAQPPNTPIQETHRQTLDSSKRPFGQRTGFHTNEDSTLSFIIVKDD
jgi:hypothetical protein